MLGFSALGELPISTLPSAAPAADAGLYPGGDDGAISRRLDEYRDRPKLRAVAEQTPAQTGPIHVSDRDLQTLLALLGLPLADAPILPANDIQPPAYDLAMEQMLDERDAQDLMALVQHAMPILLH